MSTGLDESTGHGTFKHEARIVEMANNQASLQTQREIVMDWQGTALFKPVGTGSCGRMMFTTEMSGLVIQAIQHLVAATAPTPAAE